jgi:hypothetical protein
VDVSFELSDRYLEEIGPWPLEVGMTARSQLYALADHSALQHSGRLLLPDLALAGPQAAVRLRRVTPLASAACGTIADLHVHRGSGPERRDQAILRVECGVPICLVLTVRRWDRVDLAPIMAPAGVEAWRMARSPHIADLVSGVLELQEAAFEAGGVSSFPLLDEHAPDYPVTGVVRQIERLDLDPASSQFGSTVPVPSLPLGVFWPHRYLITLVT